MTTPTEESNPELAVHFVRRLHPLTLFVPINVGDNCVEFVVDSGSSLTIVHPRVLKTSVNVNPSNNISIKMADGGTCITVYGTVNVDIQLGDTVMQHDVVVADISNDGLLGLDFIHKHGISIAGDTGSLTFKDEMVVGRFEGKNYQCCRVVANANVCIPPLQEMIVPAKVVNRANRDVPLCGVISPIVSTAHSAFLVAKSVSITCESRVPVRLCNPTSEPVHISIGLPLGLLEPTIHVRNVNVALGNAGITDGMENSNVKTTAAQSPTPEVPAFLTPLLERSTEHLTVEQSREVATLLHDYQDIFATNNRDLGRTGIVKHTIDTGDAHPVRQRPRRLPIHKRHEANDHIDEMLKAGIIEPSSSPWASPIVLARKKDGTTRFCVDYRLLNHVTLRDAYPLPRIDDCLDSLHGATWFSTIDLCQGFFQCEVDEKDRHKTAFTTGRGLYQFKVMSFGLANGPSTFERLMELVLAGLQWEICLVYLDDVIIHGCSFDETLGRLRVVFKRLRDAGLKLKPKKCSLFQRRISFLGHVVSEEGVATDPEKISAVTSWPTPTNVSEVRSFLGLCTYYRRYVRSFATIAHPLNHLTVKDVKFEWTQSCENAFVTLKTALTSAPILAYPSPEADFVLDTDASDFGIGAVVSQVQNRVEKVIAYGSRAMTQTEKLYCTTRKELLAVKHFIEHFQHYLSGRHFVVRTDHSALRWLLSMKDPNGQYARWLSVLSMYNYTIIHRSGVRHGNADGLSRRPTRKCTYTGCVECSESGTDTGTNATPDPCAERHGAVGHVRVTTRSQQKRREPRSCIPTPISEAPDIEPAGDSLCAMCGINSWQILPSGMF
jgi:predicted aspartyl protease